MLGRANLPREEFAATEEENLKHRIILHFLGFRNKSAEEPGPALCSNNWEWRVVWKQSTFEPFKSPGQNGIFPALIQEGLIMLHGPPTKVQRSGKAGGMFPGREGSQAGI